MVRRTQCVAYLAKAMLELSEEEREQLLRWTLRVVGLYANPLEAAVLCVGEKSTRARRSSKGSPRFHIHYTPTDASWLKQVERWFAYLAD